MNAHDKGLRYCKVCKKAFDQINHLVEHEDSHITSGKMYKCKMPLKNKLNTVSFSLVSYFD